MTLSLAEKYQILLDHYGNKYADFDLFFQNYEGLFVFSRIDIVYEVLQYLLENQYISTEQTFIETGSGDGRIVALAGLLGFKSYGLELSMDMKNISSKHIEQLKEKNIFSEIPIVNQGDFLLSESYNNLNRAFSNFDVFFNYYTNTEMLIRKIEQEAKIGAMLISVSLSKRSVNSKLDLIYSSALADRNHYLFVYKKNIS